MARESCNLDKDEAEILKPSSSSTSPPPPSPPAAASSPQALFLKPQQEHPIQRPESPVTGSGFTGYCPQKLGQASRPRTGVFTSNSHSSCCAQKRKVEEIERPMVRFVNRCSSCRKKVGLTGFRCRCGSLFCGQHRYSDAHQCSFDYKAAGREEIAKANPVIRAAKIIKI